MILWIHGFASCGLSHKSLLLREHFGAGRVLAPDLPPEPEAALALLEDLIRRHPVRVLAGASLGGYFATWLQGRHGLPAVLINPAVVPYLLLEDYLGSHRDCHGTPFEVTRETLDALHRLHRPRLPQRERYLVLLATGDEILDWRQAAQYYAGKDLIVHRGGDHRFQDLAPYLPRIEAWIEQHAQETPTAP